MKHNIQQKSLQTLAAMTTEEKMEILSGVDNFWSKGVPRLGVRRVRMADASLGLRDDAVPATAFPAFIALAASWNCQLSARYGKAVGEEFHAAGVDVLLGPGMNLYRTHHCGRNFEYLGEDPCLAAEMVVSYIRAVQLQGVFATAKHFAANNSDWHRSVSNSIIDERTLREVYLAVFEAAVCKGDVRSVMTSYNLLNGEYAAENHWLLTDVLLGEWGFNGLIMSDWDGTWDAKKAFKAGLFLEMPGNKTWKLSVLNALLKESSISLQEIDDKVTRILDWTFALEETQASSPTPRGKCPEHAEVALATAREGIVLLRNRDNLLPLHNVNKLAIVGPSASPTPSSGGGAAMVTAIDPVSILGAVSRLASDIDITRNTDECTLRAADAVIVCVGLSPKSEGEAFDRPFELPWTQIELIRRCTAANKNTIVVVVAGGGIEMASWIDDTAAVLHAWYPGENGCLAIAEIIFGMINPSGRLPITLERSLPDAASYGNYIPANSAFYDDQDWCSQCRAQFDVNYTEGIFFGYRHFDKTGIQPLFPFGFGLSYTTFVYSALSIQQTAEDDVQVSFYVRNTGERAGAEVAQLYIQDVEASVPRPDKELKGFTKLFLQAGEEQQATIMLPRRAFAFYDVTTHNWLVEPGLFRILIGANALDIRLNGDLNL